MCGLAQQRIFTEPRSGQPAFYTRHLPSTRNLPSPEVTCLLQENPAFYKKPAFSKSVLLSPELPKLVPTIISILCQIE